MRKISVKVAAIGATVISVVVLSVFLLYRPYRPIQLVEPPPSLTDDFDKPSLIAALLRQKHFLKSLPSGSTVSFGTDTFPSSWLLISLDELLEFVEKSPRQEELANYLETNYDFYKAGGRKSGWLHTMLVTGYYEPVFEGSYTPSVLYQTPLYRPPPSLIKKRGSNNTQQIGRLNSNQQFVPFWTREEIETADHLAGNELVYLKDPFDAYLLHVQGSGKIRFPDGTTRAIGFAGTNGLEYMSIGKILVDTNVMKLEDVNIPAIRQYLTDNPEALRPLLHKNPRFIFFQWRDDLGPIGSLGEPLTPGRSIAIDPQTLPTGTIAYLESEKPVVEPDGSISSWEPMKRLVFPQDSGSAIKGTGRVDVFWGNGTYAEMTANHMKQPGDLYFLIKKDCPNKAKQ